MGSLTAHARVVDSGSPVASAVGQTGASVQPTLGEHTGFPALEQALLELPPGSSLSFETGSGEQVLFVLAGEVLLRVAGEVNSLEREAGAYIPSAERYELSNRGAEIARIITVWIPDQGSAPAGDAQSPANDLPRRTAVSRVSDQIAQAATTEREFRILADPDSGLRSATHFVGYIPTARAPEHFHTYDEVICVIEGEGVFHAEGADSPLGPGSCIQLPARTVHCLQNTGAETMRVVAVFRPAGSPAAAYYPDGTLAQVIKPDERGA
ncbi:MAG: cupin domain-containing protein [Actinomycetota bacterium]|nr:cupin domain-containing protein [Actinomycetota bacterium]